MALEAWYDIDDDEPISIRTAEDLDILLDRMASDGAGYAVPPLAELSRHDADGWAVAYVGVNVKIGRGILTHSDPTGSVMSFNGSSTADSVTYDYMGHVREVPGNTEIPLADLRKAVHEFVTTNGARPTCVEWQAEH